MLDVSDLMSDPDFCEELTIYRRTAARVNGRKSVTEAMVTPKPFGSMQPGANPDILRTMDYQTNEGVITVYTNYPLREQTTAGPPDILVFRGSRFEVDKVNDWGAWGAGWVQAICTSVQATET